MARSTMTAVVAAATHVMERRAQPWHRHVAFLRDPGGPIDGAGSWGAADDGSREPQDEPPWDWEPAITPDPLTGQGGTEGAWGQVLADLEPGALLAAELDSIDPASVDEYDLVEMVAGYQRMAAWAHARMVETAGVLARRAALNPRPSPERAELHATDVAAGELAPRLGLSRFAAKRIVTNAAAFRGALAPTGKALRAGLIDYPKACTIARLLTDQPAEVAEGVQELVLPRAAHLTHSQVTTAVQEAIIAIDPHRATARHRRARAARRVDHPRPLPDGMASILAILPATDAAGLDLALEGAARHARAEGDPRTLDQLRADALALLGHGALADGFIGLAADAEAPGATDDASSADDGSSVNEHGGPEDVEPVMETGGSYRRTLHMPVGGIGGRRTQVRVTVPLSVLLPPELADPEVRGPRVCHAHLDPTDPELGPYEHPPPSTGPPGGPRDAVPTRCTCRWPEPLDPEDEAEPEGEPHGLGVLAEVAQLDGYGPITPDVARALAMCGQTWQRLVTDPLSGSLLDVGRTRYRPPAAVAEFVRYRDRTCVRPGCSSPALGCDLDHVVPWEERGITAVGNLAALCRRDHRTKTLGAFALEHIGGGTFEWTTPTGHRYRRDHRGHVTMAPRDPTEGDDGEPPPF